MTKRWEYVVLAIVSVAVVGISSCMQQQARGPRPGDTVTPVLSGAVTWNAGHDGFLGVRLQAKGEHDSTARNLDFMSGVSANPVATITYFNGESPIESAQEVTLSHRC